MEFDKNGNLFPYKVIETNLEVFEQIFVFDFPFSITRKRIFENYLIYLENLKETVDSSFYKSYHSTKFLTSWKRIKNL